MKHASIALLLVCLAAPAGAETVVAARTIRAQTVLGLADLRVTNGETDGPFTSVDDVIGREARVALYAGRPIRPAEIGPPALVERNQIVLLLFQEDGLEIVAEGRALGRAGAGERLRVMNLQSRQTISGRVRSDGLVLVGSATATIDPN